MSGEIQQPFCDFHSKDALIVGAKPFELEAFHLNPAFGQKRRELNCAALAELFFSVGLERNFGCRFLVGLVGKPLYSGVDVFQSLLKRPFRTLVGENHFSLIDDNLIDPVTEGLLTGFLFRRLFGFALLNQRGQVHGPVAVVGHMQLRRLGA